jgi:hypothetical protein
MSVHTFRLTSPRCIATTRDRDRHRWTFSTLVLLKAGPSIRTRSDSTCSGVRLAKPDATEVRHQMAADDGFLGAQGRRADPAGLDVVVPVPEPLFHRGSCAVSDERDSRLDLRQGLTHRSSDGSLGRAGQVLALSLAVLPAEVECGPPAAVLGLVDRALAVGASPLRRGAPPPRRSAVERLRPKRLRGAGAGNCGQPLRERVGTHPCAWTRAGRTASAHRPWTGRCRGQPGLTSLPRSPQVRSGVGGRGEGSPETTWFPAAPPAAPASRGQLTHGAVSGSR